MYMVLVGGYEITWRGHVVGGKQLFRTPPPPRAVKEHRCGGGGSKSLMDHQI